MSTQQVQFFSCKTLSGYTNELSGGTLIPGSLYFIEETGEIYKAASATSGIQFSGHGVNLLRNGTNEGINIRNLNFTGSTEIVIEKDGQAKIQIGENMNSSIFGEAANSKAANGNDGTHTTNVGTLSAIIIPDATDATFKVGDWKAGTSYPVGTKKGSIEAGSTGWIHFNEGAGVWTVTVYGEDTDTILAQAKITTYTEFNEDGTFKQIDQSTTYTSGYLQDRHYFNIR